ncbi:MAG: phosphoesterase [Ruminococcaceae bacterium]|nr:phosphoesterase [Oscillospiraceae bacterium]
MNHNKFFRSLTLNIRFYLWIILLFSLATFFFDYRVALFELLVCVGIGVYYLYTNRNRKAQITEYVQGLSLHADSAASDTMENFPLPVVAVLLDGTITWYNQLFSNMLGQKELFEVPITDFVPELDMGAFHKDDTKISCDLEHNGRYYHVFGNIARVSDADDGFLLMLYWDDRTGYETIKQRYYKEKFVSCVIVIDNYDDLMQDTPNADRPRLTALLEEKLAEFVAGSNGILRRYEKDRFFCYFEKQYLDQYVKHNFEILESIKEISVGNKIPPTLSIGIGVGGDTMNQNDAFSFSALDMALGRGGDQAIIKDNEQYHFYGGKSKEMEKRTRVKARVIAYAIRELITDAENIIIMGHKHADIDVLGAALGLYRAICNTGKSARILLETYNQTVARMLNRLDESYDEVFITASYARELTHKNTLVFVVDTHRASMVEEPALLDIAEHIVLIDHHRRSAEFIENAVITYHEPYASSASELITEVIQYMDERTDLKPIEAEALYAGIYMDTKNFTFKTGVRTFEAASYLRREGVDTVSVKRLFQTDMHMLSRKLSIVKNAQIYKDEFAISVCIKDDPDMQTIVAQAADELLGVTGITASFVICGMEGGEVIISGRSLGSVNVQVILEKLGGGGHMTIAGAQLPDTTPEAVRKELKATIDDYLETR